MFDSAEDSLEVLRRLDAVALCRDIRASHSMSLGAPLAIEEAAAAKIVPTMRGTVQTPTFRRMKTSGQWKLAWKPFYQVDPAWTDEVVDVLEFCVSQGMNALDLSVPILADEAARFAVGAQE